MKEYWKPGTMIYPLPAVLVSCGDAPDNYNLMTAAWTGTLCSEPALCYVSIRPERHSHALITRTGEFVLNLTTVALARAVDWCGVRSGRDGDKFAAMHLTPVPGHWTKAPVVNEAPVSVECRVKQIVPLGSHDMFIGEVLGVQADACYMDKDSGAFNLQQANLLAYAHGHYYALGKALGKFGWSVRKKVKK